jgi:hypothetical protein
VTSTVRSRLNHYEMLGVAPEANADAIARAFARETNVLRPQVFGAMAELCLAYETLRDPDKRRAYDASIGLAPKIDRQLLSYWSTPRPISARLARQPCVGAAPLAASMTDPATQPRPEVKRAPERAEARSPALRAQPEPLRPVEPGPGPRPAPRPDANLPRSLGPNEDPNAGYNSFEWRRIAITASGLIATAVLVGGLVGWWSGSDAADAQPPEALATAAPKEKKTPTLAELWTEPAQPAVRTEADPPRRAVYPKAQVRRPVREQRQLTSSESETELIQPPADLAGTASADPLAHDPTSAPAVAARMPLPHSTVARTIDRIGYRCGSVASAAPVEGAAGVYRVDCTSGQSFQAKPVNGRYRFRRL